MCICIYIYNDKYIQYVSIHSFEITSQKNFQFKLTVGECLSTPISSSPATLQAVGKSVRA